MLVATGENRTQLVHGVLAVVDKKIFTLSKLFSGRSNHYEDDRDDDELQIIIQFVYKRSVFFWSLIPWGWKGCTLCGEGQSCQVSLAHPYLFLSAIFTNMSSVNS